MTNKQPENQEFDYEIVENTEQYVIGFDKNNNPIMKDAFGNLFNPAEEAEYFDKRSKQDATLNMRINSYVLEDLKKVAKAHGENNYQAYVRKILYGIAMQAKTS